LSEVLITFLEKGLIETGLAHTAKKLQAMDGIKYRYSFLYEDIAECPELGLFRRFTKEWVWILYDQCAEIKKLENECNTLIATQFPDTVSVFTVTDVHRAHMKEGNSELNVKIGLLKEKIRKFSE
jgi:hypothetical protein